MSLLESKAIPSQELVYDWCQKGFVHFQRGPSEVSQKARAKLYKHLNRLTRLDAPLSQTLPKNVKIKIQTALDAMTHEYNYHSFPVQSFVRLNSELRDLPDDVENASMKSIAAIKKAYEEFKRLYVIKEPKDEEPRLKEITTVHRSQSIEPAESGPTSPACHQPSTHAVTTLPHEFKDNRSIRNSYRWCTWAKRSCQTFWERIFKQ